MKVESLVIVNHNVTVNMYTGLVHTARHDMGVFLALNYGKVFGIFYYLFNVLKRVKIKIILL